MRKVIGLIILSACFAQAAFISATIQDNRLQSENEVYHPGGIVGLVLEGGLFNEPENMVDYKASLALRRFGYSYKDGDETVICWGVELRPFTWSFSMFNVMAEFAPAGMWLPVNEYSSYNFAFSLNTRLGYNITDKIFAGVTYSSQFVSDDGDTGRRSSSYWFGGWGLNVQYNLP